MEYRKTNAASLQSNSSHLSQIHSQSKKQSMLVDFHATGSNKYSSEASTAGSLSPVKRQLGKSKVAHDTQMINTSSP